MPTKDGIEAAYCFLHQKRQVYIHSHDTRQREDIEYAVESYIDSISPALYALIAQGNPHFLRDYAHFAAQLDEAILRLEHEMQQA